MTTSPDVPLRAPRFAAALYTAMMAAFMAASSAPTPMYHLYQHLWGFSSGMLTLVFGVYAFSLLAALLVTGSLSDHLGRRTVMLGSLLLQAAAMLVFAWADGAPMLILGRVVQGIATGVAVSAISAAIVDVARARGTLLNSIAPILGMAVGALGAALLVQYAPWPLQLTFFVFFLVFMLQAVAVFAMPDTIRPWPGALASLVPRVRVPAAARAALVRIAPVNCAMWALNGFYLSLGPTLAREVTGSESVTVGGWLVFALTATAALVMYGLRGWDAARLLRTGAIGLVAGLLTTLAGVHAGLAPVFFLGAVLAGIGLGTLYPGTLRTLLPLAGAHERAGLMAAFYILSYLTFSVPAIAAGVLVHLFGLRTTVDGYAAALLLLASTAMVGNSMARRRAAPG